MVCEIGLNGATAVLRATNTSATVGFNVITRF